MDIRQQLREELSQFNMHYIADYIEGDKKKFSQLMQILLEGKDPLPPRAAWVAEIISQSHPELIHLYLETVITNLVKFTHPGSRRNSLKILMRTNIPEPLQGNLIDICFEWILDPEKTVAVKVYAMQIIENHLKLYPELAYELKGVIEDQWEKNSVGFKSRGHKVLKNLNKYLEK